MILEFYSKNSQNSDAILLLTVVHKISLHIQECLNLVQDIIQKELFIRFSKDLLRHWSNKNQVTFMWFVSRKYLCNGLFYPI